MDEEKDDFSDWRRWHFTLSLAGEGFTVEEAWEDACEGFRCFPADMPHEDDIKEETVDHPPRRAR